MVMSKLISGFLLTLILIAGCSSYPVGNVNQGGERPALVIKGSTKNAVLFLDGLEMGAIRNFNGRPNKLLIETGPHRVQVKHDGKVVYDQTILATQGETKIISISP